MLTGIINQRISERAPFHGEIKISFVNPDGSTSLSAVATNISTGGLRFYIPQNHQLLNIGDQVGFVFRLPNSGEIPVLAEIRYRELPQGTTGSEVYYGVKFLDISLEAWNSILAYCHLNKKRNNGGCSVLPKTPRSMTPAPDCRVTIQLADCTSLSGTIEAISFGGVRINLKQLLPVDSLVTLHFNLGGNPIQLKGYCVWSAPDPTNSQLYLSGIFFNHLEQKEFDQLKLFFNSH